MILTELFGLAGRVAIVTGAAADSVRSLHGVWPMPVPSSHVSTGRQPRTSRWLRRLALIVPSPISLDVTDRPAVEAMIEEVSRLRGSVDVVVNAAGIGGRGPAMDYPDKLWNDVIAVNLTGSFHVSRAAGAVMARQRSGSIVNIASIGGPRRIPRECRISGQQGRGSSDDQKPGGGVGSLWHQSQRRGTGPHRHSSRTPAMGKGTRAQGVLSDPDSSRPIGGAP